MPVFLTRKVSAESKQTSSHRSKFERGANSVANAPVAPESQRPEEQVTGHRVLRCPDPTSSRITNTYGV